MGARPTWRGRSGHRRAGGSPPHTYVRLEPGHTQPYPQAGCKDANGGCLNPQGNDQIVCTGSHALGQAAGLQSGRKLVQLVNR